MHAHVLLWVKEIQEKMQQIQDFSPNKEKAQKNPATSALRKWFDSVASTELIGELESKHVPKLFQHNCTCSQTEATASIKIESPDLQQLRNLRHKIGCKEVGEFFASCRHCGMSFTHDEITE